MVNTRKTSKAAAQRQPQSKAESARDRQASLYLYSPVAQLTLSLQGDILEANLAAEGLLGVAPGRLTRQKFTRFVTESAHDAFRRVCNQILNSPTRQSAEFDLVSAKAKGFFAHLTAVRDPAGFQNQFLLTLTAINEHRLATGTLSESEEHFRRLTEAAFEGIGISENGRICDVNDQMLKIFGYERGEMVGKDVTEFVAPETRELVAEDVRSAREGVVEHQLRRKDGSIFFAETEARLVQVGNRTLRMTAVRDITWRKRKEEAAKLVQERYILTEHAVNDGLWDWNILTDEAYHSRRWSEIVGYQEHELPNHKSAFLELIHPDDRELVNNMTREHLEQGRQYACEFRLRHKDGSYRWVLSRGKSVRDTAGRPIRMVGALTDITERKVSVLQLAASEERYRQLFELESDAIVLADQETHQILDGNHCALLLYGYSREEFLRLRLEDLSTEPEVTRASVASHETRVLLRWHRNKNGGRFAVEINASVFDHHGRALRIAAMRDITERLRADASMRENEERFLQLANNITDVFWIASPDLKNFHYISPGYKRIWGRTTESLYANSHEWTDWILREDQPDVFTRLASFVAKESEVSLEYHIVRPDGSVRWVLNRWFKVRDAAGNVVRVTGVAQDITERKLAEKKLRESEELYRLISENTADFICRLDPSSGRLLFASPSVQRILGYTQEEAMAKKLTGFLMHNFQKIVAKLLDADFQHPRDPSSGGTLRQDEVEFLRKDGSIVSVEIASNFIPNEEGKTDIIAVVRDITDRKRLERAVQAERDWLEHESLRLIEKEQERIGRDLHDGLCQILVGAKCRSALLEKACKKADLASAAEDANALEKLLNEAIQQTRDLAKGLNPVHLDRDGLVYALEGLATDVEKTNRSIHCRCRFSLNSAITDRTVVNHLFRITQEAVQNAIKHGKVHHISIALRELAGTLELTITDDGKGALDRLRSTKGAGLHNMKTRTAMIGGTLSIQRAKTGGSVVSVKIPARAR